MADREPYKWITVKGKHIPVYKDEYGQDVFGNGVEEYKDTDDMVRRVVGDKDSYFSPLSDVLREEVYGRKDKRAKLSSELSDLHKQLKPEEIRDEEADKALGRTMGDLFVSYTDKGKEIQAKMKPLVEEKERINEEIKYHENRLNEFNREQRMKQQNEWLQRISTQSTMKEPTQSSYQGFKLNESTTGRVDDALKTGQAKVVEMSPKEYIERANYEIFRQYTVAQNIGGRSANRVNEYAEMMRQGVKFDTPYLDYENEGQEGIHRALAAIQNGYERIPVIIVSKRR